MIELEVKAPAGPHTAEWLASRGEAGPPERHVDLYLNHPGRDFAVTDEALRLRTVGGRVELTYKGPKMDGSTKTRRELTMEVEGLEAARGLLEALGFHAAGEVRKRRTPHRVGEWTVVLDEVEGLGRYVEVERVLPEGTPLDAYREEALALLDAVAAGPPERRSYLELLRHRDG